MEQYIRYVLLADGINAEALLSDLMSLERKAYASLAKTPEALALVNKSRVEYLSEKLVDFSLTPEEWKEYRTVSDGDTGLSSFESFYQEADSRDHAMAKNVLKAIQGKTGARLAILVTGGYHSPGLTAQLTQAGATVISVVPKIEKLETTQGATYLSVFTQEKTPLEKLFAGEKLFLAQNPINETVSRMILPCLIAAADGGKTFGSLKAVFTFFIPNSIALRIRRVNEKIKEGISDLKVHFKEGWTFSVMAEIGPRGTCRFRMEILKQSVDPLKLFEEQLFVLPASIVKVAIAVLGLATANQTKTLFGKYPASLGAKYDPSVNLMVVPEGEGRSMNGKIEIDSGRATSLWGVKLAELLFGKRFGVERVGKVYKVLAPLIGTGLALATTALGWGGIVLLDGSAVACVIAPWVGAVFGGIFFLSHYLLPESWLPKSHSREDISFPKVLTMAILYAVSITLSLGGISGIEIFGLSSGQAGALSLLAWPVALLSHGIFDGWPGSIKALVNSLSASPKALALPRGTSRMPETRRFPGARFRLIMNTSAFDGGGKSRVDFKRVENALFIDGKEVPFTSTALNEVRGEPSPLAASDVLALLPNGNLGMNDWFVGFSNGTFYHKPREDWEHRAYDMLVQPVEGRPRVQTLRFQLVNGRWKAYDVTTDEDVTTSIAYAVFGQRIVKAGKNNVENLADQFDDLRHLFRFPMFEFPGNGQMHLGFNDGSGELYHARQKVAAALRGEPVTLSLEPLNNRHISETERDRVFAAWGYVRRAPETALKDLTPGDYVVSDGGESLTTKFLPGIHPHSFVGLSQTGDLMAGLVPGQTHHEGISVNELANRAVASGAHDFFLWANGKDAKVSGPSLSGEAENARSGYMAAIVFERPAGSGQTGYSTDPRLLQEQHQVSSQVISDLGARPLNQGVAEFMDRAARKTVETFSQGVSQSGNSPLDSRAEDSKGTLVLFVDSRSVDTIEKRAALSTFIRGKKDVVVITNANELSISGLGADRLFHSPGVFSPVRSPQGVPLGSMQVSLAGLVADLINLPNHGNGFHFVQTAVVQLNTRNLGEAQQDILHAAESAWVLNAFFQLTLPAHLLDWNGIIETLTAIARNA